MGILLVIIVLLVLLLTGAIVPVLIFGGWALVAILIGVLLLMILASALGLVATSAATLFSEIGDFARDLTRGPVRYPSRNDPDFAVYLDWANCEGPYRGLTHWEDVVRAREVSRKLQ